MGSTITEKILARAGGLDRVTPGQNAPFRPDYMIAYDYPGYTDVMFRQMAEDFGIDTVKEPERYVLFIDHMTTRNDEREQRMHDVTREWGRRNGVAVHEGLGIGHQVSAELGYAMPGRFLVHFDGHVSGLGAFGALGWGVRKDLLEAWVTGAVYLDVPASTRFHLEGRFAEGVDNRDLIHHLIARYGADACAHQVMEYTGPGAEAMTIDRRQGLCAMAMFTGAVSAIFNPDEKSLAYVEKVARSEYEPVCSDPDATYAASHTVDLGALSPQVVLPGSAKSANTRPVEDLVGTEIQHAYIGSCASGRIEEIRAAAELLKGKKVAPGVRFNVVPTSQRIYAQAKEEGLLDVLAEAGARVAGASCDFCVGYASPLAPGDKCVSTGVLNISGRMGSTAAEIYLGSAYTVAASALAGHIVDPREVLA
ncbi:3-isopropylmalate/(R)-2-methylmalate dehydratase large subunit [Amycolatopsis bartoniae]|uniref:3-isopropylmalate dehydratase large subunit n=1 Tax=Amycolatopsis bartoniae TaxID=941986 RepID=A0A8H9J381_9PSEU|nr:aconitase family protein [Amycolatopsis bartoniae]MBB2938413.1 3-isopropylmalate/(R)-2-methylmalate dehydratase large subunit [Amycolatopsis bartoniae]GHF71201.1 3-isopropylmalate dehydratase large subunit [Amycolatopsis bartoniae]